MQSAWKDERYPHKRLCSILRRFVDLGGGDALFFAGRKALLLDETILANWRSNGTVDEGELAILKELALSIERGRGYLRADELQWNPGFEDYGDIIAELSTEGRGPKRR
uniref:Uncharacterized protein n=1 Tax=Psilocybe cubensis TaxID=181762 RepID=A0A8H8CM37_PSICU